MTSNVELIYTLILNDLKAKGWTEESIAEAVAECQRERQTTGADDNTLCVKEWSYLSFESLQLIAKKMGTPKTNSNIFVRCKNWFINLAKDYWHLNWEAKIGILFLIPPILGVINFLLIFIDVLDFEDFPEVWTCIDDYSKWEHSSYGYAATPAIPLYLGLMAIAGAYLIKGNLKKDK